MLDLQHGGHFLDCASCARPGAPCASPAKANVVGHAHGRVKRVALEHHGDVALGSHADDVFAGDFQFARGRRFQPGNDVQQRGFAAARGADQNQEFAGADFDVDLFQDFDGLVALAINLADACDVEELP